MVNIRIGVYQQGDVARLALGVVSDEWQRGCMRKSYSVVDFII